MHNIEIKAPVPDPDALLNRARDLGASWTWTHNQRDTFFKVPKGFLKLREVDGEPGELIAYVREEGTEPRLSDYDIARLADPEILRRVLSRSLGVLGVVEKTRALYLWKNTRIHLDSVEGLGEFLELETVVSDISMEDAQAEADWAIQGLGLDRATFLGKTYMEMLLEAQGA